MTIARSLRMLAAGCTMAALAGCQTAPPPPVAIPAAFRPLGVSAPYLLGDVIGGHKARAAKMRSAKIRPLGPYEISAYMADLDAELRRQTAGIGLDVLQVGGASSSASRPLSPSTGGARRSKPAPTRRSSKSPAR